MAEVSTPNPAAKYHEGKNNRVLSIAPVQSVMVRYVDPDGKESIALCYVFGEADYKGLKDAEGKTNRRMTGVWVVANLSQLQNTMRLAPGPTAVAVINAMEEKGLLRDGKVVGTGTVAPEVELPDVSDAFTEIGESEKKKG